MSGGGSSGKNYYGFGKGKGGRKGDPIIWEGPLGPDSFPEPVFEFPFRNQCLSFRHSTRVNLPMKLLFDNTITVENRGQNANMVRTA